MKLLARVAVGAGLVAVGCVAGFAAGRYYGKEEANSGGSPVVMTSEDMFILGDDGRPHGTLPAGTRLYGVPDHLGDRPYSRWKVFVETLDIGDHAPIVVDHSRPEHAFEVHTCALRSDAFVRKAQAN